MVTKQQLLEWAAIEWDEYPKGNYIFTREEWQQERDKMQKQADKPAQPAQPAPDNSWHERGELPPVGVHVELWWGGSFAYNCELITRRGHHYVVWNLDADRPDAADYMNSDFRPIRTEREKAIDALIDIICAGGYFMRRDGGARKIAERIYDAGLLK